MFVLIILVILVLYLGPIIFILVEKTKSAATTYKILAWTHAFLFLLILIFDDYLVKTIKYVMILVALFVNAASLILGITGLVVLNRFGKNGAIIISIILALMPLLFYLFYYLFQ
jgi:hypothetical protein